VFVLPIDFYRLLSQVVNHSLTGEKALHLLVVVGEAMQDIEHEFSIVLVFVSMPAWTVVKWCRLNEPKHDSGKSI
jgi:flavoprotein